MMKANSKVKAVLENFDVAVACTALATLIFLTCFGVFMRYILNKPLTWLEEVQLFCMVWVVFAASGTAFRLKSHVAIEMIVELFPQKAQRIIGYFIDAIVVLVIGYLFYQSIGFIKLFIRSGRSTSMLNIPYWFIYGIVPFACVDMIVSYFYQKYFSEKHEGVDK